MSLHNVIVSASDLAFLLCYFRFRYCSRDIGSQRLIISFFPVPSRVLGNGSCHLIITTRGHTWWGAAVWSQTTCICTHTQLTCAITHAHTHITHKCTKKNSNTHQHTFVQYWLQYWLFFSQLVKIVKKFYFYKWFQILLLSHKMKEEISD